MYNNDDDKVNLFMYLTRLGNNLIQTYDFDPKRFHINFEDPNIDVEIGQAINFGLILNELITNAIKHAFPENTVGSIDIKQCNESPDLIQIIIQDDGIGLQNEINFEDPQTLGFRIVHLLIRQLRANLQVEKYEGTRFIISFTLRP
jgi:hypothetical protein